MTHFARRMVAILVLCAWTPVHTVRAASVMHPANLASIHMVTSMIGWGTNQTDVLHTSDGGRHWTNVTPPIPWDKGYSAGLDIVDGQTAWFEADNSLARAPTVAHVFHTLNAGRSWVRLPPLRIGQYQEISQLQFVDATHGWMVVIRGAGMSQISFDLYRTGDGGRHWWSTLVEEAFAGKRHTVGGGLPGLDLGQTYTFQSRTAGWVSGCYCGLGLTPEFFFHTTNGGHTWHPYHLNLPTAYRPAKASVGAVTFFSRKVGVLPVYLLSRTLNVQRLDLYHTVDGGRTWYGTRSIPIYADNRVFDVVDRLHAVALDIRGMHSTSDGGRSWHVTPFRFSRSSFISVDFVNALVGFTIEGVGSSNRSRLYETIDGGRTWSEVRASLYGQ